MCSHFNIKCGFFKGRRATFTHFLHAGETAFPRTARQTQTYAGQKRSFGDLFRLRVRRDGCALAAAQILAFVLVERFEAGGWGSIRTRRVPEMTLVSTTAPTPSGVLTMLPTPGVILFRYSYAGCS